MLRHVDFVDQCHNCIFLNIVLKWRESLQNYAKVVVKASSGATDDVAMRPLTYLKGDELQKAISV